MEDMITGATVVACFDGHGVNGHKISQFFKEQIENRLFSHPLFTSDIDQAIKSLLIAIEYDIYRKEARLADYSGTTMILAVLQDRKLTIANIGDSRIIVGKRCKEQQTSPSSTSLDDEDAHHQSSLRRNSFVLLDTQQLSRDHKPDCPDEYSRICATGGRVFSVRYSDGIVGPARVWLGNMNIPGLAMSRSLGDFVVHTAGVISTPEFTHYDLTLDEDLFLVAATDGLWDCLSNQEVVNIVAMSMSPAKAIEILVQESQWRWFQRDRMVDDTTISIVQFTTSFNSTPPTTASASPTSSTSTTNSF
jgi:serine/threonine protein phosphatase PrpC